MIAGDDARRCGLDRGLRGGFPASALPRLQLVVGGVFADAVPVDDGLRDGGLVRRLPAGFLAHAVFPGGVTEPAPRLSLSVVL